MAIIVILFVSRPTLQNINKNSCSKQIVYFIYKIKQKFTFYIDITLFLCSCCSFYFYANIMNHNQKLQIGCKTYLIKEIVTQKGSILYCHYFLVVANPTYLLTLQTNYRTYIDTLTFFDIAKKADSEDYCRWLLFAVLFFTLHRFNTCKQVVVHI